MEELKKLRAAEESTVALVDKEMWLWLEHWLCPSAVRIACALSLLSLRQGLVEELKKLRAAEESTVALVDEEMWLWLKRWLCSPAVCIACALSLPSLRQGLVEELKKLRAAEESTVALVDEEMTARFSGDVTLTVCDAPIVLSPHQVLPSSASPLPFAAASLSSPRTGYSRICHICRPPARARLMAQTHRQTVSSVIFTAVACSPHGGKPCMTVCSGHALKQQLVEECLVNFERVMKWR